MSFLQPASTELAEIIEGTRVWPLTPSVDARGEFTEVFRDSWQLPLKPVQWSFVTSKARVLRGMHLHTDHDEYFALVRGSACVGLYDLRPESSTSGQSTLLKFNEAAPSCLCFPQGVLHGWYFFEDSIHLQATSEEYVDYHPADNRGCHWSDPDLNIPWPDRSPIVAERAAAFPMLSELTRQVSQDHESGS